MYDDKPVVSKKLVLFILFIIIVLFGIWIYFTYKNQDNHDSDVPGGNDSETTEEIGDGTVDYSKIYGRYVNESDSNSYIYISEDTLEYRMNICEGYFLYDITKYTHSIDITDNDGVSSVRIAFIDASANIVFTGEYFGDNELEFLESTPTCSGSEKYIRE
ncbi:MAG: hypothetical protein PHD02_01810 [Bacilli bacterium]|nr:hypothetical protein [Bacilli bacterium]